MAFECGAWATASMWLKPGAVTRTIRAWVKLLLAALAVSLAEQDVQLAAVVEPLVAARDDVVAVGAGASGLAVLLR
eukprot:6846799-Pyramimonas_sp.AAC.1